MVITMTADGERQLRKAMDTLTQLKSDLDVRVPEQKRRVALRIEISRAYIALNHTIVLCRDEVST